MCRDYWIHMDNRIEGRDFVKWIYVCYGHQRSGYCGGGGPGTVVGTFVGVNFDFVCYDISFV